MLIDSHCHLDFPDLATKREAVLARAEGAGVGLMLTISTRVRRFSDLLEIVEPHGNVYCSIGTHPHHAAEERDITLEEIVKFTRHPKVVAIGEAGLDYHYDNSPRDDAGARLPHPYRRGARDRPAARDPCPRRRRRHCRHPRGGDGAWRVSLRAALLHRRARARPPRACARRLCLLLRRGDLQECGSACATSRRDVPLDRLLVETDAPYLAPEPLRGRTNEPANRGAYRGAARCRARGGRG